MFIYSLEKIEIGFNNLYNLFQKTIKSSIDITITPFFVTDEYNGRLDLICKFLYGNTNHIEELMVINNIINPYSIKSGNIIYFVQNTEDFKLLYDSDPVDNDQKDRILNMNKNKISKKDTNRIGSPPTIKPDHLKQMKIDYDNHKITILNKFK